SWAEAILDLLEERRTLLVRDADEELLREHAEPVAHAVLAAVERGRAVEQEGEGRFETVAFEDRRELADARVVPGTAGGRAGDAGRFERLDDGVLDRLNVALAAKLEREPPARLQRGMDASRDRVLVRDPMEDGVGEDGAERLG